MRRSAREEQDLQGALYRDQAVDQLRIPPQSVEAEQAVLGGLMLVPDSLAEIADVLKPEHFYRRDHNLIFSAIQELAEKERPYDAVTLGEWFARKGQAELVAGGAYLIELASTTPSAANIRAYAEIVRDKHTLRSLIDAGSKIVNDGFAPDGRDTEEILAEAATRVTALASTRAGEGGLRLVRNNLKPVYDDIAARYAGEAAPALLFPHDNVTKIIDGLEATDFMILAARPGMGKTVMGLEIADHTASRGKHVALFSLEMSSDQLTTRLVSKRSGIPASRMRTKGGIEEDEWPRLTAAIRELRDLPLAIDDYPTLTMRALAARAKRMHAKVPGGLGLVVVDYIQLMEGSSNKADNRQADLTEISRGLKLLAKTLRCPVVGLSQLNRGLESRTNKRPIMSDLRESGALEQDADVIAFLYRDGYYNPECAAPNVTEFILGKYRNGKTETAYLDSDLACSRFFDWKGAGRPRYSNGDGPKTSGKRKAGYEGPPIAEADLP